MPSVIWYNEVCNYNNECESIGLKSRFRYSKYPQIETADDHSIKIDTREQKPLSFLNSTVCTLKYADYASDSNKKVFIERKSLSDFISTISSGYDRFQREIGRAKVDNSYIFIAVEESLNSALSFEYLPHISRKIKASSDFVFKRVRELLQANDNIQFVFLDNRKKMIDFINTIYSCQHPESYDWQFLLESKKIIL